MPPPDTIAKSVLGVPPVPAIEGAADNVSAALPVFSTVTVCAALVVFTTWLEKLSGVEGDMIVTIGAVATAVPVRATDCGLPVPLSVRTRFAVRGFGVVPDGLNVMAIVQVKFG